VKYKLIPQTVYTPSYVQSLTGSRPDPRAKLERVVVRSGYGLCWRTGYWTPAAAASVKQAGCACDSDLIAKDVCAPAAKPAAPAPAPAAARPVAPAPAIAPVPAPIPVPVPKPAAAKVTLAADALFDFDSDRLRAEGKAKLDDLVAKSKQIKLEVVIAVGHADRLGEEKYNQTLSERRAAAVKSYLVGKGIEANRVYAEGKGEKQPVTGDKCKGMGVEHQSNKKLVDCLQPDRRVDIEVIGTK
jgi:OOP family OmpA-OmpF porin